MGNHSQIWLTCGVMGLSILRGLEEDWDFLSSWETLTHSLSAPMPAFGWLFSVTLSPSMSVCPCRAHSCKPTCRRLSWQTGFYFWQQEKEGGMTLLTYNLKTIVLSSSFAKIALVLCLILFITELLWKMLLYERLRYYDRYVLLFLIVGKPWRKPADKLADSTSPQREERQSLWGKLATSVSS